MIVKSRFSRHNLRIDIAQIDQHIAAHGLQGALQVKRSELVPLGEHHQDIGAIGGL